MNIRCTTNRSNGTEHELTVGAMYCVLGIEADDYRVLSDAGVPLLYPSELFEVVDASRPADWVTDIGENGEEYAYPPELNEPGFFEEVHAHEPEAVAAFARFLNSRLGRVA